MRLMGVTVPLPPFRRSWMVIDIQRTFISLLDDVKKLPMFTLPIACGYLVGKFSVWDIVIILMFISFVYWAVAVQVSEKSSVHDLDGGRSR